MLLPDDFPPHVRLLFLTTDPTPDGAAAERIRTLPAVPDFPWPTFVALAEHHRLVPLVFESLTAAAAPLPPGIQAALQRQSTRNAFAALQAAAELARITEAFRSDGVPLLTIKGVALSQQLYGSPTARHVGDLDLLTAASGIARSLDLLTSLGYARTHPAAPLTPRRLATFARFWKDITLSGDPFDLDFHWRLFNNPRHPANRLLLDQQPVDVDLFGHSYPTLNLRDSFLYTAAHAAGESFTYLKTLADVAAFLRLFTPSQLADALEHARTLGLHPQVSAAIHLARAWLLPQVESNTATATHPLARALHRRTESLLLRQNFLPTRDFPSTASWLRLEHLLTPGPRLLVEAAGRYLFRPRVWSAVSLPDSLFALYPLIGLLIPPRRHTPPAVAAGQSHAAPRTPLESPNRAGTIGVSKSPPNT